MTSVVTGLNPVGGEIQPAQGRDPLAYCGQRHWWTYRQQCVNAGARTLTHERVPSATATNPRTGGRPTQEPAGTIPSTGQVPRYFLILTGPSRSFVRSLTGRSGWPVLVPWCFWLVPWAVPVFPCVFSPCRLKRTGAPTPKPASFLVRYPLTAAKPVGYFPVGYFPSSRSLATVAVFWDFGSLHHEALRRPPRQLLRQRHTKSVRIAAPIRSDWCIVPDSPGYGRC